METDLNATAPVAPSPETGHLWVAASEPKVLTQAAPLLWEPSPQSVFSSLVLSVVGVLVCSWDVAAGDCKMEPFIDLYTASTTSTNSRKRNGLESGVTDYQNCSLPCHKHRKAMIAYERKQRCNTKRVYSEHQGLIFQGRLRRIAHPSLPELLCKPIPPVRAGI